MEQSMSYVGHCIIDNGPTEGLWGIIKSEMYCMYKITDEISLRSAIDKYIKFYAKKKTAGKIPLQRHWKYEAKHYQRKPRYNIRLLRTKE